MTLKACIQEFLLHCSVEKNLSQKTLKAYKTDLVQLINFLESDMLIGEISKFLIRNYISGISHLKPKSIKRKISTLKAMFNYLEFDDKITINPFRKMRLNIKADKRLPTVMSIKEIYKILNKAYTTKTNVDQKTFT